GGEGAAAGIFSIVIAPQYNAAAIERFCDQLQYFKLGYSWGGPMSLVMPYAIDEMRGLGRGALVQGTVVRFCIGLEATADLVADLAQAWQAAFGEDWQGA
ncbi:MAG: PLP-dependent transferase, partial [Comamonas sp.]